MNYYKSFANVPDILRALKDAGVDGQTALAAVTKLDSEGRLYEMKLTAKNRTADLLDPAMMQMVNRLKRSSTGRSGMPLAA